MSRVLAVLAVATAATATATAAAAVQPARRICRPGPNLAPAGSKLHNVLIVGDSISLGAMSDVTKDLASVATVEHAPFSGDGGALDVKYAMDTDQLMVGAGSGPPWVPGHSAAVRYGDGCLNGTFLTSTTQQPTKYDVISFNYGVHDVCYSGYLEEWVPLPLYKSSIRAVKRTLQRTGSKVVFQASTPVEYNLTTNARILAYNAAAKAVMAEDPPAVYSDLYAAIVAVCGEHLLCFVLKFPVGFPGGGGSKYFKNYRQAALQQPIGAWLAELLQCLLRPIFIYPHQSYRVKCASHHNSHQSTSLQVLLLKQALARCL